MVDQASSISKKNLEGGFVQIPLVVLTSPILPTYLKVTYALLLDFMRGKGYCYPSHSKIGVSIGRSRYTVMEYIKELERFGLISSVYRGNKRTNIYYQTDISKSALVGNSRSGVAILQQENVVTTPQEHAVKTPLYSL